jgi:pimeloyl-ACP methyl ester carboxylesterase
VVDAKYTNAESQFLTMKNGSRVHYRDQGNNDGLPVVLIHGAMASLHTWEPWVAILGKKYRVITLDLPAHGLTGMVPSADYGGEAFTQTIHAVTQNLGLRQFVIGGNSMGGGATWRYTLAHPKRVLAMVLVDSVPPGNWQRPNEKKSKENKERGAKKSVVGFSLLRQDWFRAIARYFDPKLLIGQGLRAAYNDSPVVDEKLIQRYYDLMMREGTRAAILSRNRSYAGDAAQTPDLSDLTQPTLVMWGAQDVVIPVSLMPLFQKILPNTTTVVYEDLGHIPMEEDPERTAIDVMAFLETLQIEPPR